MSWKMRAIIGGILLLFILFIGMTVYGFYKTEYSKKPIVHDMVAKKDAGSLYQFYLRGDPTIKDREYYGLPNATIVMIAYTDIASPASRLFMAERFPNITQDYIYTGKMRFYHKNYLTTDDVSGKTDNYIYAKSLSCVGSLKKDIYYDFSFDLFTINGTEDISGLVDKYGIPREEFLSCIKGPDGHELAEDISEVDNFGMVGISPRFYIGIPDMGYTVIDGVPTIAKLKRTIREYQLTIGD